MILLFWPHLAISDCIIIADDFPLISCPHCFSFLLKCFLEKTETPKEIVKINVIQSSVWRTSKATVLSCCNVEMGHLRTSAALKRIFPAWRVVQGQHSYLVCTGPGLNPNITQKRRDTILYLCWAGRGRGVKMFQKTLGRQRTHKVQ